MADFFEGGFKSSEVEAKILEFWEREKVFEQSLEKTKNGKPFTFYDGPPFATGLPHYGHILASTIKDLIPRYQTMQGRFVRRRWGWDCHGLPIEELVERKLGISGKKQIEEIGIKTFNETCRSMVLQYTEEWGKMVRRIARWTEFDNSYKTMDRDYMESVWWAFKQIYDKGLIYEGRKVLMYCPRCETPISNFEVAMDNSYKDVTEEAVTVRFRVKPGQTIGSWKVPENTFVLAWTTTPWTLPGNVALAVGQDIQYSAYLVSSSEEGAAGAQPEYLILADSRAEKVFGAAATGAKQTQAINGSDLIGLSYEPLFNVPAVQTDKSYKIYAADFVTTEEGTGVVHTAVVYGEDDYKLGLREGLPVVPLLDEKGKFNEEAPEFLRGHYFKDTERFIKKDLEERGLLFKREQHQHSYPHCWRCGNVLFYNAIPAWFINIQKIKANLLASNDKEINWFPDHLKHGRYEKSVEAAPDWNISRNRYWGNPIPVWKCEDCNEVKVVGSVAELGQDVQDLHRPYIDEVILKCEACGGKAKRIPEIFDSWVEAGSMPFSEYHYPFENKELFESRFPGQFVAEYIAQTRAWFYVMHVISHTIFGKAPFDNVVTTGTILAEDGSKMSKSKNNFPDPWVVIEKYGIDSLRFYLMNSVVMQADNVNFSLRDLENVYRKNVIIPWNVYNYFATYAKEKGWTAPHDLPNGFEIAADVPALDRWIMARTKELVRETTKHFDAYDTVWATRTMEQYIDDLSTWYLRRSRGREDQSFFLTMYRALIALSQVIAPVMPYLSEGIYKSLMDGFGGSGASSVHLTDWPKAGELTADDVAVLESMAATREAASIGQAIRKAINIPVRQPLPKLSVALKNKNVLGEEFKEILRSELNVKEVVDHIDGSDAVTTIQGTKLVESLSIDTVLSEELELEGFARTMERFVQELRKQQGFKVGEMATITYSTESEKAKKALALFDVKKTYTTTLQEEAGLVGESCEVGDATVKFAIARS